jgi:hypothetical protein
MLSAIFKTFLMLLSEDSDFVRAYVASSLGTPPANRTFRATGTELCYHRQPEECITMRIILHAADWMFSAARNTVFESDVCPCSLSPLSAAPASIAQNQSAAQHVPVWASHPTM